MIIELSPIFADLNEDQWRPYAHAVENLIAAHSAGWHAFSPSRDICASLLALGCLSRNQEGVVRRIAERASVLGGQAAMAERVMLCWPEGEELRTFRPNQVAVPLRRFDLMDNCSPSQLLTENSAVDGAFLTELCRLMSREIGYSAALKIDRVHGGGGTMGTQYAQACSEARPTLCVVDSDRKYENCTLGTTARGVLAHRGTEQCPTTQIYVLPVRELENAVPVSALYEIYSANPALRARVTQLCAYAKQVRTEGIAEDDNVLHYFDFKSGITRGQISAIPEILRPAFVRFAQIVCQSALTMDDFDDILDPRPVHPGISVNMLSLTLEHIADWSKDRHGFARRLKSSPNWTWLNELLRLVAAYGVAGERTAWAT